MPKAKPVSLHPLNFDEAIQALIRVDPNRDSIARISKKKQTNKKPK